MRYLHLDVFTTTPFEGNQLAVFPEPAAGLATERMQRIAAEMAFSETTFLFPAEQGGDVRMRIFTPQSELPMAGHPTIGTTFALAAEGAIAPGTDAFVFELGVGPTPVSLEWTDDRLSFAWMTQRLPSFDEAFHNRDAVAAAIGLDLRDLAHLPVQPVSCGVPFLFVPVVTRAAVDRAVADRGALARAFAQAGRPPLGVFLFTTDRTGATGDETVYSRMFAPEFGIQEDPGTGGASGPLGSYLVRHGVVAPGQAGSIVSLQGAAMGRPCRIHISIAVGPPPRGGSAPAITGVRVGGASVLVARGELLA